MVNGGERPPPRPPPPHAGSALEHSMRPDQIAELAQQTHANVFLRLDKLLFEQRDKRLPLPRMQAYHRSSTIVVGLLVGGAGGLPRWSFRGEFSHDGDSFSGGWRPNPGADETINFPMTSAAPA
jgi:hypothetical protein